MYRFEWNFNIQNQEDYKKFVEEVRTEKDSFCNYEQLARLFYCNKNGECVMVELQVPTKEMIDTCERDYRPWLDVYSVQHIEDYDASNEIFTGIGKEYNLSYDNAETTMLALAKELCDPKEKYVAWRYYDSQGALGIVRIEKQNVSFSKCIEVLKFRNGGTLKGLDIVRLESFEEE